MAHRDNRVTVRDGVAYVSGSDLPVSELLRRLAAGGPLEELHPDSVRKALEYAAGLAEEPVRTLRPASRIYSAHNGFMAGVFAACFLFHNIRGESELQEKRAARITEFLWELGNTFGVPMSEPDAESDSLESYVDRELRAVDEPLADHFQLGLGVWRCFVVGSVTEDAQERRADLDDTAGLLRRLGYSPSILTGPVAAFQERGDQAPSWQDLLTACLGVEREMIAALPPEPDTAFVALPFREPYLERYVTFYRSAAELSGLRTIRAWGDLGRENHQELLLALIAGSGALIADVTESNPNVALEVGFALGDGKRVYLLAEERTWRNMANVQLDWVYPYRAESKGWEQDAAFRAHLYFKLLDELKRPGKVPSWSQRPLRMLELLASALADEDGERS